jgi:hypothetical protein
MSGATLAPGASCTVSVNVDAAQLGYWTNVAFVGQAFADAQNLGNHSSATIGVDFLYFYWFFAE